MIGDDIDILKHGIINQNSMKYPTSHTLVVAIHYNYPLEKEANATMYGGI